jgi:pectate disaccharide-lyase
MKISRTCSGATGTPFDRRVAFTFFAFALAFVTLTPARLDASQYYTNWINAHFSDIPALSGPLADPDGDGEPNVVEFAFGTDPRVGGGIAGAVQALNGGVSGTNSVFQAEILESEGHQPGVQIDLYLSANLTDWFRPWWLRTLTNSLAGDPAGSVRELFTTQLPGTNIWFVRPKVQLFELGPERANYYVATNGNDSWAGTSNAPYANLSKVVNVATSGTLVYVRGGRYTASSKITFAKLGSAGSPIRIRAFPGESPVLDFSGQGSGGSSYDAIAISGSYYWFYGLTFTNAGHSSIAITGSNNIIERCVSLGARDTGFHIGPGSSSSSLAPASNLFLNCDSIRSYDSPVGGDADGFAAKYHLGIGNAFSGCRGWENSDDNWDFWTGSQPVLITNCWAFRAATNVYWDAATNTGFNGNGQGFKLGGAGTAAVHRVVASLSFNNKAYGIDQNNNAAGQNVDQNTVWNNGSGAINLTHLGSQYGTLQSSNLLRNNVAIGTVSVGTTPTYPSIQRSNTWNILTTVDTNDFLSVDYNTWAMLPRRDDGGLPETPFMRPVPTGRLVDKGTNFPGSTYVGSHPDLGAYETVTW